jgi:1-acyl-sn-glycerol-3-phosphate acyltransferase
MLPPAAVEWISLAVLLAAVASVVVMLARDFRRSHYTAAQFPIFVFNRWMTRLLWRAEISGPLPVKPGEGAVIVCNHIGPIDPAFIALGTDRSVHWMVAREFCEMPILKIFFRTVEAVPVGRGGIDTAATKLAIRYAQRGDLIGLFPEGRINETERLLLPGRPGAALIALKAEVPVIPCHITDSPYDGSILGFLLVPSRTRLKIGKPIDLSAYYGQASDRAVQGELTKLFLREIAKLGGVDAFEPELAGRNWKTANNDLPAAAG